MKQLPVYLQRWRYCPECASDLTIAFEEEAAHIVCTKCNFMQFANPAPTSTAMLFRDETRQEVLLGLRERDPKRGTWALPGGFMDWGEDPLQTAIRELREETGMSGHSWENIGAWKGMYNPTEEMSSVNMHYAAIADSNAVMQAGSDVLELKWVHLDDIGELPFENQRLALAAARKHFGI